MVNRSTSNIIISFNEITEVINQLRAYPFMRGYADRLEKASTSILDVMIQEISQKEREVEALRHRMEEQDETLNTWLMNWKSLAEL